MDFKKRHVALLYFFMFTILTVLTVIYKMDNALTALASSGSVCMYAWYNDIRITELENVFESEILMREVNEAFEVRKNESD